MEKWSKIVAYSKEYTNFVNGKAITVGRKVKMFYKKKWYERTVLDTEHQTANAESDS